MIFTIDRKTEQSRITYNKIAFEYDTSREGQYTKFHIKELTNTIDLSKGNAVLDVACGNGTLLRELSKKEEIQANGIDISENMIHRDSIDIITVCCAFHHFDNPQGFVNECKRVLKKNGIVYIAEPNFGAIIRFLANKFWFFFSKSGDVRIYSKKELETFFYNCGFKSVQIYRKEKGVFLKAKK